MITLYEPLGLDEGHKLLEIGLGSGYSIVIAREIVGPSGLVVSIEIDTETLESGRKLIENTGYHDIILVQGDGCLGYSEMSPYDRICITAACVQIPPPLIEQLKIGGRLIAPVIKGGTQEIVLLEKSKSGISRKVIRGLPYEVPYVPLSGKYGVDNE
jgi:protein-L-isoaspartate(D-aspartate) O-methyltransferase